MDFPTLHATSRACMHALLYIVPKYHKRNIRKFKNPIIANADERNKYNHFSKKSKVLIRLKFLIIFK